MAVTIIRRNPDGTIKSAVKLGAAVLDSVDYKVARSDPKSFVANAEFIKQHTHPIKKR